MHLRHLGWSALICLTQARIIRKEIIDKFNPVRTSFSPNVTALQVGNGDFAFNVDQTGLQTFLPFNTMASWAWHNDSLPDDGEQLSAYHGVAIPTHGRDNVYYDLPDPALPEISQWIIANPNKFNLGRIFLKFADPSITSANISGIHQELHLYEGSITSTFIVQGTNITVRTSSDFDSDSVSIDIQSNLISQGQLGVQLDYPFSPIHSTAYKFEVFAGSYEFPTNHTTRIVSSDPAGAAIYHDMGFGSQYYTNFAWKPSSLKLTRDEPENSTSVTAHRYSLSPLHIGSSSIAFTANFAVQKLNPLLPSVLAAKNALAWAEYWETGGFIDLTASSNPKADELQRRIILSNYHVRVNSAGAEPPQESGLMNNGWYGKFHLEMLVFHLAHWNTWGREQFIQRIVPAIYEKFLPSSLERARKMGWKGARWPKMTDSMTGRSSPGAINAQLIWQQPHPMYFATMEYQISPTMETLRRWETVLSETANYMASFAWFNASSGHFDIGPPAYGVTENTPLSSSLNLAYETAYWRYGLDVAASWKLKLGQPVPAEWSTVSELLADLPTVAEDETYVVYEGLDLTMWNNTSLMGDPRSLIMLKGFLPDVTNVNETIAHNTAKRVWSAWTDDKIFGWGWSALAMNAIRLGEPERAISYLTNFDAWEFDDAGFAVRGGGDTPPPFMPGNAGFLLAVAYMVVGWEGCQVETPGFPNDGSWTVRYENLRKAP